MISLDFSVLYKVNIIAKRINKLICAIVFKIVPGICR